MQNLNKEYLLKKVYDLETGGGRMHINYKKKNKCPLPVSKGVADAFAKNILEKTPIRFHDRSFDTLTINYKSN